MQRILVKVIAGKLAAGTPTAETLRELLALTIAVVGATEQLYRAVGRSHPEHWNRSNDRRRPSWTTTS